MELFTSPQLFTPGPTPVLPDVWAAGEKTFYHRSEAFQKLVRESIQGLKPFFGTTQDPILLTASGTGGMEALVLHVTRAKDPVLVIKVGKFGERFEKLAQTYGCDVTVLEAEAGKIVPLDKISAELQKKKFHAVFLQANETATGVYNPVKEICALIRDKNKEAFIIVDAISGLVAHRIEMDAWGIDGMVSGSQKGFGVGAGLAFVALSQRASAFDSTRPRFYLDLKKEAAGQHREGRTAWTPALTIVQQLHEALKKANDIGPEKMAEHHARLTQATRSFMTALGLELFVKEHYSHALTSILCRDFDAQAVLKTAREEYSAIISGGQDDLKGKILRFSHLGFVSVQHLISGLMALEFSLYKQKVIKNVGAGVAAAMHSLAE